MNVVIEGCPVADGQGPCCSCGGGWPGTQAKSEQLTQALVSGRLIPEKLGCGPLVERATAALQDFQQQGVLFEEKSMDVTTILEPSVIG